MKVLHSTIWAMLEEAGKSLSPFAKGFPRSRNSCWNKVESRPQRLSWRRDSEKADIDITISTVLERQQLVAKLLST